MGSLAGFVGEGGPHDMNGVTPFSCVRTGFRVLHATNIVGVCNTYITYAAENIARDVPIAAGRFAAQVGLEPAQPLFGSFYTVMSNESGNKTGVIRVLPGPRAEFAFPFGIGQRLIGKLFDIDVVGDVSHPVAHGKGVPVTILAAQIGRNDFIQNLGFDRLGNAALYEVNKVPDVDGHQD